MQTLWISLVLLAAVVASDAISRGSRSLLPLPLVQIALGAAIAQAFDLRVAIPPDMFFLLFVAPLLFLDGWRIPKGALLSDKWTITALAFGLVLFTVVGAGYFINWLIPPMPLPVAFALAAVLSPTDAVAVSAIAKRAPFPKRLLHILEGESLLNDASGLVCMRFAIAAAVTGGLSVLAASAAFLWLVIGGVGAGLGVTLAANAVKDWTARHFGEETGTQILVSLLLPFGAYVVADRIGASGILSAVTAGIAMNREEQAGRASAITRLRRAAVWDALQFASNGVIFVLLGHQLPGILAGAGRAIGETGRDDVVWLAFYVFSISLVLVGLRAVWSWAILHGASFRRERNRATAVMSGWRLIAVASLAGVRGAVTLSAIMSFPLTRQDGSPFPTRELAIFLAAGVIVTSLLAANLCLPFLLRSARQPAEAPRRRRIEQARIVAARSAIAAIDEVLRRARDTAEAGPYKEAGARVLTHYRKVIDAHSDDGGNAAQTWQIDRIERELRLIALGAERQALYRIARSGTLSDEVASSLVQEVDLEEFAFQSDLGLPSKSPTAAPARYFRL